MISGITYLILFVFKQKTAYEMRISDWSSDVCSSDLRTVDYIYAGDIYQANITQRFQVKLPDGFEPLSLYARLRAGNPAPFAAFLRFEIGRASCRERVCQYV